jgi:hypothetical protein
MKKIIFIAAGLLILVMTTLWAAPTEQITSRP